MHRRRVGVDIDGVIYDFENALRDWCVLKYGWDRSKLVTATQWELATDWGITRDEFVRACEESVDERFMFVHGRPINDAVRQLGRLRKARHEIHLITARDFGPNTRSNTYAWLDLWRVPYDTLTFSHSKTVMPIDCMIDDKPGNVEELANAGIDAYLQDRPYNRDFEWPARVASLEEFVDQVNQTPVVFRVA